MYMIDEATSKLRQVQLGNATVHTTLPGTRSSLEWADGGILSRIPTTQSNVSLLGHV